MAIHSERAVATAWLCALDDATSRLLGAAAALGEGDARRPSLLPGWSRAHVLTHLARGADSRVRLLTAARTGADIPQYTSGQDREREIAHGANRPLAAIRADLAASAARLRRAVLAHPADRWDRYVRWLGGVHRPARAVLPSRLRELEIHHVDLAVAYTPRHWAPSFVHQELADTAAALRRGGALADLLLHATDTGQRLPLGRRPLRTVRATSPTLLMWLAGRPTATTLHVHPPGPLPAPPAWR
ncbi:maleylpyruvate isomerase [Pilimelia terevasa]|uniref:Maleylpyruvate isomerase n=1 Tax=Pilimelia terevasa TaxID=53372 RepID=A0A8J3BRE5_9ACTN|nr:maleylpyruvate isomerase family mycothiol-dependent enzyme [Pilimelia terevasa]GGK32829.1 maleylpyruvate isomerase [Pilimelia terevasa]